MQMLLESMASFFTNLILVLVYFLFLLFYRVHIKIFFLKHAVASQQGDMEHLIDSAANISQQLIKIWINPSLKYKNKYVFHFYNFIHFQDRIQE
jgi:predicted PurR-regulated permease PerM